MADYQWGFDLTDFKSAADFAALLKRHGISDKPVRHKGKNVTDKGYKPSQETGWIWKGKGIKLVTANNPISGEYYRTNDDGSPYRENEKGYASYIGIEGEESKVRALAKDIKKIASAIKDEEEGTRGFI